VLKSCQNRLGVSHLAGLLSAGGVPFPSPLPAIGHNCSWAKGKLLKNADELKGVSYVVSRFTLQAS
jgi:hypothetical protein